MNSTSVYSISCNDEVVYVGISVDPKRRWRQHLSDAVKKDRPLYRAMRERGVSSFNFNIFGCDLSNAEAVEIERVLIQLYRAELLNLAPGGHEYQPHEETVRKRQLVMKKMWSSAEHVKRIQKTTTDGWKDVDIRSRRLAGMAAANLRPEVQEKRRIAYANYKMSPEALERMRTRALGNKARAKLTAAQVEEIRTRLSGGETQKSLAEEFGMERSTLSYIARGKTWRVS